MIDGLKPYGEYRPSTHPWLGQVPAHWNEQRAKLFYREVDERSATGEEELMSVSHVTGVTLRKSNVTMFKAESTVGYKICRPGDIVINTMWAFMGALGVARQVGLVSPSYGVYRPHQHSQCMHPDYIDRLIRIDAYKSEYLCRSTGIHSSRLRLYPDQFLRIPLLCPPPEEQAAIVRFLDTIDRRVKRYIRAKRKLIALLNEQKQAIIHRAVTRGLDPNVPLKPSGVSWLGDVPEHWEVLHLNRISVSRCDGPFGSGLASRHYTTEGIRVIRLQNIRSASFVLGEPSFISEDYYKLLGDHDVIEDDLLIAGLGDTRIPAGRACIAPNGIEPAMVKADCFRFRLMSNRVLPLFMAHQMSATAHDATVCLSSGATRQRINLQEMSRRPVTLPPIEEQASILSEIKLHTSDLERAIDSVRSQCAMLATYHQQVIADSCVGKLDVREAAAALPDELEAIEPDAEELLDNDEATGDVDLDAEPEEVEA